MKLLQIIAISICLILGCHVSAQNNSQDLTGSILWKISGNGLSKPSYVFGTHHLISKNFLDSVPGLQVALENTNGVTGEIVLTDIESKAAMMMQATMMPEGESYKNVLSPEDYEYLDCELKKVIGAGLAQMGMFKPSAISNLYVITAYQKKHPESSAMKDPIDLYFQKMALEKGKSITGLETVEEQIELLYMSRSITEQAEDLICTLKNQEYMDQSLDDLEKFYRNGDLNSLTEMFDDENNPCPSDEEFQHALIAKRNNNWILKLDAIMQAEANFIAVGSGHLGGEDGILYQLRKKGYIVEPVK